MNKFDESIKNARAAYEPRTDFVSSTMKQVASRQPRHRYSVRLWAPVLAGGLAVIALLFVAMPFGGHTTSNNMPATSVITTKTKTPTTTTTPPTTTTTPATTTQPVVPAGTDDASLQSDLNDVSAAQSQEDNDQGNANSALNDSQQEIAVPTD
jgi:hypothetical protein